MYIRSFILAGAFLFVAGSSLIITSSLIPRAVSEINATPPIAETSHLKALIPVAEASTGPLVAERPAATRLARTTLLKATTTPIIKAETKPPAKRVVVADKKAVHSVPFFSQFTDITEPSWRKVGCGIASLAMLVEFYNPNTVNVDTLLAEGIQAKAYLDSAGWTHAGLIGISKKYGLTGESVDLGKGSMSTALSALEEVLSEGPVMVSVHYTFQPTNPIPHLVVATGIREGKFFYNDPADTLGNQSISLEQFQSAWKKRYITIRPITS